MVLDAKLLQNDEYLKVRNAYIGSPQAPMIEYIHLCENGKKEKVSQIHRAFMGDFRQIRQMQRALTREDMDFHPFLFIAGDVDAQEEKEFFDGLTEGEYNILSLDMTLTDALNRLHQILGDYRWWKMHFDRFVPGQGTLQEIVDDCGKMLDCPVFLLNMGYSLAASCGAGQVRFLGCDELINKGFLPVHAVSTLRQNKDVLFYPVRQGVSTIAYFLVCPQNGVRPSEVYITLALDVLQKQLRRPAGSTQIRRIEFEQLVYDLIEMHIQSSDEVRQRIELLDLKFQPFYCCVVITARDKNRSLHTYIPELRAFFPEAEFAMYSRSIVILVRQESRYPENLCSPELKQYLEKEELMAGVSPGGRRIEYFRTFYIMAMQALKLGRIISDDSGADSGPLYYFEDYRMAHMVDLCREGFLHMYNHEDVVFMCHPVIVVLARYDESNQTNLLRVLYTFLKNSCNLAQTARELNYHRNTIMNKIAKIEEVAEISLDDPRWPPILLFSCMVYFIMKKEW